MEEVFLSFNIQVPMRKAMIWGKLSCGSCRLKSASILCLRATPTSGKTTVSPVSEFMMVRNQSTTADAISKELEWLEDINKTYTAGKTETEAQKSESVYSLRQEIKDPSKVRNKTAEAISWSAFQTERQTQVALKLFTAFFFRIVLIPCRQQEARKD